MMLKFQKLHKKAMMDDFFDLIFTVMVSFFLLFFLNFTFQSSVETSNKQSLEHLADFNRLDSALNNIRVQLHHGESLEGKDLSQLIQNSKILGGKVITNCRDYFTKEDCTADQVSIHSKNNLICSWNNNLKKCEVKSIESTIAKQ